ncbi:hypothetical protein [Campylobacter curvus]|uniref:hypothetical protein n=1 Tax=Campylobacter curvus TaxID=200 RepID=UPI0014705745|nr:hypothetical protein [Campylobacter curvus]
MGDEILMKILKYGLILAFCLYSFGGEFEDEIAKFDAMFAKIQDNRQGISKEQIASLKTPFKKVASDQNSTTRLEPTGNALALKAIMQNRANINGKWYGVGDIVDEYSIARITHSKVTMIKNNEKQELSLANGSKNVGIKIK